MLSEHKGSAGNQSAEYYIPHPELVDAAEVAVELGMPLLLTGEPGTGKTECARWVGHHFKIPEVYKFVAKSTSVATDLFYTYDALGRFSASQLAEHVEEERRRASQPGNFIEYAALGKAILAAHEASSLGPLLPKNSTRFQHPGTPQRSVVLIDEIDKAPRDFPNDLLDEISNMQFRVRELGDHQTPVIENTALRPIVVVTSNSERQLPGPFLRRCAFYNIPFPQSRSENETEDPQEAYFLEDIVAARLGSEFGNTPLAKEALAFFHHLRTGLKPALGKKPATAELLNWMVALRNQSANGAGGLVEQRENANRAIGLLLKNQHDQERGRDALRNWSKKNA